MHSLISVSVVIPAYNCERYIARTIDSVLAQTRPADEIIVVDDGSTDKTADVIRSFGDRVILIQQENAGASAARNTGIKAASGDWIAFLDGDDEWLEGCLQKHGDLLERNRHLQWTSGNFWLCHCDQNHLRREKLPVQTGTALLAGKDFFEDYFQAFVAGATGWTGTKFIKKSALIEAGMFTPRQPMANDLDMWWRIAYQYPQIGYCPEPLAVYHLHVSDSITKVHRDPQLLSDFLEKHIRVSKENESFGRFHPCLEHMLRFWLHKYLHDDRIVAVRNMVFRFQSYLPFGYVFLMKCLTVWPQATTFLLSIRKKMNKLLQIRT